ncbi:MAG: PAS domain S-box protein [candidate division WOR-3 bacterium]|nr:PAS domain S-box protein [candidate division WOR-3 bacterium]
MLSSKGKIRLVLVVAVSLSLGTALVSLLYMNAMISRINQITLRDAKLVDLGRDISIKILDARREEKNFIIYLDSTYIGQAFKLISQIGSNVEDAKRIAPEHAGKLDSISLFLENYRSDIAVLAATFQEDPRALSMLQRQLVDYEEQLKKTVSRSSKEDSLPAWLSDLNVLTLAATTKLSTEKARLLTELRETSTAVLSLSGQIVAQAQTDLAKHSEEGVRYGFKAQRNTLTIFIITLLLLAYLIIYFPRYVLLPFQRITRTLKAISKGDAGLKLAGMEKGGEFSELYNAFQDAIFNLKLYNDLKTERIVELEKQFRSTIEEMKEACLVLSYDLRIVYANSAATNLLGMDEEIIGKNLSELPALWKILESPLTSADSQRRVETSGRIKKSDLRKRNITVISFRSKANDATMRVVIIK